MGSNVCVSLCPHVFYMGQGVMNKGRQRERERRAERNSGVGEMEGEREEKECHRTGG